MIENAVYHGIEYVHHKGFIHITACKVDGMIQFKVIDNDVGIPAGKLVEIRKELAKGINSDFSIGYGLCNVDERLLLYYGNNQKPITIDSEYREEAAATLTILIPPKTIGGNKYV